MKDLLRPASLPPPGRGISTPITKVNSRSCQLSQLAVKIRFLSTSTVTVVPPSLFNVNFQLFGQLRPTSQVVSTSFSTGQKVVAPVRDSSQAVYVFLVTVANIQVLEALQSAISGASSPP